MSNPNGDLNALTQQQAQQVQHNGNHNGNHAQQQLPQQQVPQQQPQTAQMDVVQPNAQTIGGEQVKTEEVRGRRGGRGEL